MTQPSTSSLAPETTRVARATTRLGFFKQVWPSIKDLAHDDVFALASSVAFNSLLSCFPFLLLLLSSCRLLLHWKAGYDAALALLHDVYLPVGQDFIVRNLNVMTGQSYGRMEIFSVVALVFTASGVFIPVEIALNRAWNVSRKRGYWRRQALIMLLVVACWGLALGATALASSQTALVKWMFGESAATGLVRVASLVILQLQLLPFTIAIFALLYYFLPSERVPIRQVLEAAVFAGVVWEASKYLFKLSLPLFRFEEVYGPFRFTVTLVVWAYFSALLLLLGANLSACGAMSRVRVRLARTANQRSALDS